MILNVKNEKSIEIQATFTKLDLNLAKTQLCGVYHVFRLDLTLNVQCFDMRFVSVNLHFMFYDYAIDRAYHISILYLYILIYYIYYVMHIM